MVAEGWEELLDLVNAMLEGQLSAEEADRLTVWLSVDEDAQAIYLQALQLHAELTLAFCDDGTIERPQSASEAANSLDRLSGELREVVTAAVEDAVRAKTSPRSAVTRSNRDRMGFRTFSRRFIFTSLATLLTVVAVFGSEQIVNGVLALRRAITADKSGGMIVSRGDQTKSTFLPKSNVQSGTRRIGSSGHAGVALASVFLFPLPSMQELERIESARLEWTLKRIDGNPKFSVDLYGLGFVEPGLLNQLGFWEGPIDKSSRAAYGMKGSAQRRVALVKRGAMTPQIPWGRVTIENRGLLRFLQSLYDDGAKEGDFAVFRLNADTPTARIERETGYAVVHPPSISELTLPDELPALVVTAKSPSRSHEHVLAEAVMEAQSISEHWSGGLVRSFNNLVQAGGNVDGTRRVGSSVDERVGLVNVLTFSLPPIESLDGVESARLQWTLASKDNAPEFSVDLYGLGYVRGESYHGPCFWEGGRDAASPADYGLRGGSAEQVALIARRAMSPASPCGPVVVENLALVNFLRSLYDDGAQEGDLVVFRLNSDIPTLDIMRGSGYSVIHAPMVPGKTVEADLPVLLMMVN